MNALSKDVCQFQPMFKATGHKKITRLELGGPVGGVRDRVFVALGSEVKGFTKKGKNFLSFDTNLSEPVQSMLVWTSCIFTQIYQNPSSLYYYEPTYNLQMSTSWYIYVHNWDIQ